MTYSSAIEGLSIGQAAKLPTWRGYVKKTYNGNAPADWSETSAYSVGDIVSYSSATYICKTAIPAPTSPAVNQWDSTKWIQTQPNYVLTYQELQDPESGIGHDDTTEYPFQFQQSVVSGTISWTITAPSVKPLSVDAELQRAYMSDAWIVGSTADFEAARQGTGRW